LHRVVNVGLQLDRGNEGPFEIEKDLFRQPGGEAANAHRSTMTNLRGTRAAHAAGQGIVRVADVDRTGPVQLEVRTGIDGSEFQVRQGTAGPALFADYGKDVAGAVAGTTQGRPIGDAQVRLMQERLRTADVLGQHLVTEGRSDRVADERNTTRSADKNHIINI